MQGGYCRKRCMRDGFRYNKNMMTNSVPYKFDILSPKFKQMLKASILEVDQRQIDIYHQLSFADRFRQGCAISDMARNVVVYRIRQENPQLNVQESHRMALQRAYRP